MESIYFGTAYFQPFSLAPSPSPLLFSFFHIPLSVVKWTRHVTFQNGVRDQLGLPSVKINWQWGLGTRDLPVVNPSNFGPLFLFEFALISFALTFR